MDQGEQRRHKPRSYHSLPSSENSTATVLVSKVYNRLKKVIPEVEKKKTKQQEDMVANEKAPQLSNWSMIRPYMSNDFVVDDSNLLLPPSIAVIPGQSQENILMEDLLSVLGGFQGTYIQAQPLNGSHTRRTFTIADSIEATLRHLLQQILPLAADHSLVIRFIEEKLQMRWGRVNQALAAAMDSLVTDYMVFIAQLETQLRSNQLSLQKMFVYLQSSMQTFKVLARIAHRIMKLEAVGGKTLTILHEEIQHYITDKEAQKICIYLAGEAAVPFFDSLQRWLHKGVVFDPFNEFLVKDNVSVESDTSKVNGLYSDCYWNQRYTLCSENIPTFLSNMQEMILSTGRYLNTVRQCRETSKYSMEFIGPPLEKLVFSLHEEQYLNIIEKAYQFASSTLLDLLMTEYDIINRIKSLKRYFLMEQGDFIVQLLDLCEEELVKPISEVVPSRLQCLFELALRTSTGKHDPYKEDITLTILTKNNTYQILSIQRIGKDKNEDVMEGDEELQECSRTGLEGFAFHVNSEWPLSLLFNEKVIGCYQMLFRHLVHCKHVDRRLCRVWISDKAVKQLPRTAAAGYLGAFSLRQRMLFCVQNLEYYMMEEAIEPNWIRFMSQLSQVHNIDELLTQHSLFVEQCMKDCMFGNHDLLLIINQILAVCIEFCDFIQVAAESDSSSSTSEYDWDRDPWSPSQYDYPSDLESSLTQEQLDVAAEAACNKRMQKYFLDAELTSMISSDDRHYDSDTQSSEGVYTKPCENQSFENNIRMLDHKFTTHLTSLLLIISTLSQDESVEKFRNILYRINFNGFYKDNISREQFASDFGTSTSYSG